MGLFDKWIDRRVNERLKAYTTFGGKTYQLIGGVITQVDANRLGNVKQGFLGVSTVYSIVTIISRKAASIPWVLYKKNTNGKKFFEKYKTATTGEFNPSSLTRALMYRSKALDEVDDSPLLKLLENPNERQSGRELFEQFTGFRLITGNSYLRVNAGQQPGEPIMDELGMKYTKEPVELCVLPAQYVDIIADVEDMWNVLGYQVSTGKVVKFDKSEIIHWKMPNYDFDLVTGAHLYGLSPLRAANKDITAASANKTAQASQSQNQGARGLLVRNDEFELDRNQVDQLRERLDENVNGNLNQGRAEFTNANLRWEQFGLSSRELELIETSKALKEDLCNIYNFPPNLLLPSSTHTNLNEAVKYLTTNTVKPHLDSYRDLINQELVGPWLGNEYYYDYDISELPELQEDMDKMATALNAMPFITPNEKRVVFKYDKLDDPNMDVCLFPNNLSTLEDIIAGVQPNLNIDPNAAKYYGQD